MNRAQTGCLWVQGTVLTDPQDLIKHHYTVKNDLLTRIYLQKFYVLRLFCHCFDPGLSARQAVGTSFHYRKRLQYSMQYYVRITAEVSLILVSCETPIQREQFSLVYIRNTCSIWYFTQFVRIAIFTSLHVPAGACIPVASASPIHVPPVQRVLKHCGAHIHKYIYTHVVKTILGHPSWPASWGVTKYQSDPFQFQSR